MQWMIINQLLSRLERATPPHARVSSYPWRQHILNWFIRYQFAKTLTCEKSSKFDTQGPDAPRNRNADSLFWAERERSVNLDVKASWAEEQGLISLWKLPSAVSCLVMWWQRLRRTDSMFHNFLVLFLAIFITRSILQKTQPIRCLNP